MDFVQQQHWDESYQNTGFAPPAKDDFLRLSILKYISPTETGKAIEIGCYPGGYLSVLGDLGYELNGIDLTPKTEDLTMCFKNAGYKVGKIEKADFTTFATMGMYDVVASFGFVEHFDNYLQMILKHVSLVNRGGYLIISTPNFRGILQYIFHLLFDTPGLRRHNLKSMNPEEWAAILAQNGFEIMFSGYGGGAQFWMDNDQLYVQKILGRCFLFAHKWLGKICMFDYAKWNHPSISCDCLLVAKKLP